MDAVPPDAPPPGLTPDLRAALGERGAAYVAEQVAAGRFRDAGALLRAALVLMEEAEAAGPGLGDAEIRALVEEGDASGEAEEDAEAFFDRLEAKYAAMAMGRRGAA